MYRTCCDHRVAKMLADDMLEIYLQQRLQEVERQEVIEISRASLPNNPFRWTVKLLPLIRICYLC